MGLKEVFKSFLPINKHKDRSHLDSNKFKYLYLTTAVLIAIAGIATCFVASSVGFAHLIMLGACLFIYAESTCPTGSARPKADYFRMIALIGAIITGGLFATSLFFPAASFLNPVTMGLIDLVTMAYATTACLDITTAERVEDPIKPTHIINSIGSILAAGFAALAPFIGLNVAMIALGIIVPTIVISEIIYIAKWRGNEPSVKIARERAEKSINPDLKDLEQEKIFKISKEDSQTLKQRMVKYIDILRKFSTNEMFSADLAQLSQVNPNTKYDSLVMEQKVALKHAYIEFCKTEECAKILKTEFHDNTSSHTDAPTEEEVKFLSQISKYRNAQIAKCSGCLSNPEEVITIN